MLGCETCLVCGICSSVSRLGVWTVELQLRLEKVEVWLRNVWSGLPHLAGYHERPDDSCGSHENVSYLHDHQVHDHEPQTILYECDRIVRRAKEYNGAETSTQSVCPQSRP